MFWNGIVFLFMRLIDFGIWISELLKKRSNKL